MATSSQRPAAGGADAPASEVSASFELGGRTWRSRLIVGTGGFRSLSQMEAALAASGTEIVTVALRRVAPEAQGSVLEVIERRGLFALPNTAGCYTARDAVRTARLAREAFETDWIKLEVIGDDRTLLPDPVELLRAPEAMAVAMRKAVEAGLIARGAGRIPRRFHAEASTSDEGLPDLLT